MRVFMRIAFLVLLISLVGAVGYGVWNAGYDQGLIDAADATTEIVVTQPRSGFFPFGAIFGFFLLFLLFGMMAKFAFGCRRWRDHHRGGPGRYRDHMQDRMSRWHDEAHGRTVDSDTSPPPSPVS